MSERKKDLLALAVMLGVMILFFAKILFTHKIIRAPDIINEYYWSVLRLSSQHFLDIFRLKLTAVWDIYSNSGNTLEGGGLGGNFLFWQGLLYYLIPPPVSVAWFIVLHLFLGGCGTYLYCRAIGAGRIAALLGGLVFALAPENASLINAGHVLKIATISVAPWAFYFFERGFQSRRPLFFLTTGFVLALQFFYTHWQIAYYTCLGIGLYGVLRTAGAYVADRKKGEKGNLRLVALNLVVPLFFLTTVAIDLMPLANWSVETNRGALSGANQGKGGLNRAEAMSWSLPPEELVTFVIPGFFGFSRQEGGVNPPNIDAYYWGRMIFTQTSDYMGLLPWLLLPLPLIFRRDRYTWLAVAAVVAGILVSMGKYTPVYNFLFDHFPGMNRFRVPKMVMFLPLMAMGVMAARGMDILVDPESRKTRAFRYYSWALLALPILLLAILGIERIGAGGWMDSFYGILSQPTRYEKGAGLVARRWGNLVTETLIAASFAALYCGALVASLSRKKTELALPVILILLFLADVGRVDAKFMFLVDPPREAGNNYSSPVIDYLSGQSKEYRVLQMNGGAEQYSLKKIPMMFTPMPVQQRRWQDFLDAFTLTSRMPDMINLKYLVMTSDQYERARGELWEKYKPVFRSPDNTDIVVENRTVLPKAWLVSAVARIDGLQRTMDILRDPAFDPATTAIVESPPPITMAAPASVGRLPFDDVTVDAYGGEHIVASAKTPRNSLLVMGEKYYRGWKATVDGKPTEIYPVDHVLRGVYLTPGEHRVEFTFDPMPFKIGKWLTLASFLFYALFLGREIWLRRQ